MFIINILTDSNHFYISLEDITHKPILEKLIKKTWVLDPFLKRRMSDVKIDYSFVEDEIYCNMDCRMIVMIYTLITSQLLNSYPNPVRDEQSQVTSQEYGPRNGTLTQHLTEQTQSAFHSKSQDYHC